MRGAVYRTAFFYYTVHIMYISKMRNAIKLHSASDDEFENYPTYRSLEEKIEAAENLLGSETDDFSGVPDADYDFRDGDDIDMDREPVVFNKLEIGACGAKGVEDRFQRFGFKVPEITKSTNSD